MAPELIKLLFTDVALVDHPDHKARSFAERHVLKASRNKSLLKQCELVLWISRVRGRGVQMNLGQRRLEVEFELGKRLRWEIQVDPLTFADGLPSGIQWLNLSISVGGDVQAASAVREVEVIQDLYFHIWKGRLKGTEVVGIGWASEGGDGKPVGRL